MDGPEVELDEEFIDIFDDRAQKRFDAEVIVNGMEQLRKALAVAKVNKELAQHGMLEKGIHPNQFKEEIRQHLDGLKLLKGLWESLGDEGLAHYSLEAYEAVPPTPLTDPVKIT